MDLSSNSGSERDEEQTNTPSLAKNENKAVWCLRFVVLFLLFAVTLVVCLVIFYDSKENEYADFEQDFKETADKIVETIGLNLKQRFGILEAFAKLLTSTVLNDNALSWPFVTLSDFGELAQTSAILADVFAIGIAPRVETFHRAKWEAYVQENDEWLARDMAAQNGIPLEEVEARPIVPKILNMGPQGPYPVTSEPGPYFPVWQHYPATNFVFFNMNLYGPNRDSIDNIIENHKPVTGPSFDFLDPETSAMDPRKAMFYSYLNTYEQHGAKYEDDPILPSYVPVFERLSGENRTVVAVLIIGIYWKTYFRQILPSGANGILVILENNCGQQYTYRIDGKEATFLSHGDIHDPKYDYLEAGGDMNSLMGSHDEGPSGQGNCLYSLRVYPSQDYEDSYTTNKPMFFALSLAAAFVFTSFVFILYDYCVERRQKIVSKSAKQSGELVSSLFPELVRQRLYEERESVVNLDDWNLVKAPETEAIANLYPDCTILFADLAGFTKWSSTRSPTEVFELLETLYGAFDAIATRRRVFKVETIGDCYVAATGIPKPQSRHAIIMCKFATQCMNSMRNLINDELKDRLGEDTGNLSMRFGLHSGPVTAGVLRADKARFQIFGDTVNTAARMESNGIPEKIHVSEVTAKLLTEGGKDSWLTARDELVEAKGKGKMQTYWVTVNERQSTIFSGDHGSTIFVETEEDSTAFAATELGCKTLTSDKDIKNNDVTYDRNSTA